MNAVVAEPMIISTQDTSIEVPSFSLGGQPTVLGDIYQDEVNIAIWRRHFDQAFVDDISQFVAANPNLRKSLTLSPESAYEALDYATDGHRA